MVPRVELGDTRAEVASRSKNLAAMKNGHVFLGILAIVTVSIAFAGCNPNSYGGGGGGGNPTPTPPIPSGDYYVNAGIGPNNEVFGFSTAPIASNGQPSALTGSPYNAGAAVAGGAPFGIALTPNGSFLYVANAGAPGGITGFPVNADGSLGAAFGPVSTNGNSPNGICVDPGSALLVAVNNGSNTIESFTISAVNGTLTAAASIGTGLNAPVACAFSTDSKTVYVSNSGAPNVAAFSITSGGTLAALVGSPYTVGSNSFQGIVATSSAVFAATPAGAGVGVYQVAGGGALVPLAVVPSAAAPAGLAISPNGKYLYVASQAAEGVDVFSVSGSALSHLAGPYQLFTNGLTYVSVNSAGTLLVALNVVDHAVSPFAITGAGTLGFAPQAEYVFGSSATAKAIVAR